MALVVILALSLAAGCRWSAADETVLRFWAMGREGEVVAQLLPEFERTHPGIRVTVQQLPWTAAHEKLLTAFAGGTTPDVCQLGNTWIPEFVALKALEPLDRDWLEVVDKIHLVVHHPQVGDGRVAHPCSHLEREPGEDRRLLRDQ